MKRALTLALTVALIGGLAFMGVAGTAAAQPLVDQNASVDIDQDSSATTEIDVSQSNSNSQSQAVVAGSLLSASHKSYASATGVQTQDVEQTNENEIEDVYTVSANVANDNDATNDATVDISNVTNVTAGGPPFGQGP